MTDTPHDPAHASDAMVGRIEPRDELKLSPAEEARIDEARRRGLFKPPPMVATIMSTTP
jgi:hypothetical protein